MKKILLSVLVGLASYTGTYASNGEIQLDLKSNLFFNDISFEVSSFEHSEKIIFFDNCVYSVFWTDTNGFQHSKTMMPIGTYESYSDCVRAINEKLDDLRSWGYTIDKYSIHYGEDGW
ncbi:hypothetical protein MG290_14505 (plasmid) [Flavobacterium sp. CBA20B-1]|uniref:hypothetical protein n=1 Tax=unclassified Flavobacterium TaxID=196869 RepID=UPI0022252B51|nr:MULTISPECIES: hypothetical protein [unclassified Flavobacterium]WCM43597.1 hypothetical protein MG290_14505 [Flavobacterium sp. CBA20B-1]